MEFENKARAFDMLDELKAKLQDWKPIFCERPWLGKEIAYQQVNLRLPAPIDHLLNQLTYEGKQKYGRKITKEQLLSMLIIYGLIYSEIKLEMLNDADNLWNLLLNRNDLVEVK